jgi:uncharacterized protein
VLVDTGFLVSVFDRRNKHHESAITWLHGQARPLWCGPSVLVEAAHFLPRHLRPALALAASAEVVNVMAPDAAAYRRMAQLLDKYADLDPDWADVELVWLAEHTDTRRIATLDAADFGVYRINGRQRFDIVWPRQR